RLGDQAASRRFSGMSGKDQLDGESVEQLLKDCRPNVIFLQESDQRPQRAALRLIGVSDLVEPAPANAMILLGSIDQMKIDGKGANHIDGSPQVAPFNNLHNFSIKRINLRMEL